MCFPQGEGFPEAMPTAPAIPGPIPKPFEGVMLEGGGGDVRSRLGDANRAMRRAARLQRRSVAGKVLLFILLLAFSWGGKPPQRPQKSSPGAVSEVNN